MVVFADAAGDRSNNYAKTLIANAINAKTYEHPAIRTQMDNINCSIFANQDLTQMSKMSAEDLKKSFEEFGNTAKLHPQFIKNAQSQNMINKYKEIAEDANIALSSSKTLDDYLTPYSVNLEFTNPDGLVVKHQKSYAILFKKLKHLERSLELLKSLTPEEFENIYQEVNGYNIIGQQEKIQLSDKQGINAKQKQLIFEYKINMDIDKLNEYFCFIDHKVANRVFDYITQGINPNSITPEDKIILNDRFNQVKNISTLDKLTAVLDYGLDIDKVLVSACFYEDLAPTALSLLAWAKETGGDQKVREVFEQIKGVHNFAQLKDNIYYKVDKNELLLASRAWNYDSNYALKYIENAAKDSKNAAVEVFNNIKNLKNKYQFTAVLECGLNPEEVKNAPCFAEYCDAVDPILALIKGNRNSAEIFNKVKNLTNKYEVEVVLNCGLDQNEVKNAPCFNARIGWNVVDTATREKSVALIKEAFMEGGSEAAKNMLNKIKNLTNIDELSAVLEYHLDPNDVNYALCFSSQSHIKDDVLELIKDKTQEEAINIFKKVKNLYLKSHLKAVLEYDLDPDDVNKARIFSGFNSSNDVIEKAFQLIKQAHEEGGPKKAKEMFDKIKDLERMHHFNPVLVYGLNAKKVRDSSCFYNENTANSALKLMKANPEEASNIFSAIEDCNEPYLFESRINNSKFICEPILNNEREMNIDTKEEKEEKEEKKTQTPIEQVDKTIENNHSKNIDTKEEENSNSQSTPDQSVINSYNQALKEMLKNNEIKNNEIKSVKEIVDIIKSGSGWIYDDEKSWNLVKNIVNNLTKDQRILVVSEVLEKTNNTSRRDRLLSFLPDDEKQIVESKVTPTLYESMRKFLQEMRGDQTIDNPSAHRSTSNLEKSKGSGR